MNATQLTRFLDPAAETRALVTDLITVLGLDPEGFPSLRRMTKAELEYWSIALRKAGEHHPAGSATGDAGSRIANGESPLEGR